MCASTCSRTCLRAGPLAAATQLTCSCAYARLMSGSGQDADALRASTGTADSGTPVLGCNRRPTPGHQYVDRELSARHKSTSTWCCYLLVVSVTVYQ